ncbi:response regulator [Pendulispora rubella]|uniref:Response regulator n=1 Tax=Pendulispora rubella TaxID=2741070 RepID=A0ABZ2LAY8_9BACT
MGRILLIHGDANKAQLLAASLQRHGHQVDVRQSARAGFERACAWLPDCIVCHVNLEDIDGFWVARRIRTELGDVASTPFLFLTSHEERQALLQGLHVGADATLCEPFTEEELAAQVSALIEMARRLHQRRDSFIDGPVDSSMGAAFRGDLAQMSLATVLMILEMERRTGTVTVVTVGGRKATMSVADSGFVACTLDESERPPTDVLREVLHWKRGRFWFRPEDKADDTKEIAIRGSIGAVMLDAMRLGDEATILGPDEIEVDLSPSSRPAIPSSKRGV